MRAFRPASVPLLLIAAAAGCGAPGPVGDSESALTKCDIYSQRECDIGPNNKLICWCELAPGYDCDPLTERTASCQGQQPVRCVGGHYQNAAPICDGGTSCTGTGQCTFPSASASSPAVLSFDADWKRRPYPVTTPPSNIPILIVYVHWYAPWTSADGNPDLWYDRNVVHPHIAHDPSYYEGLLFGTGFPTANQYYSDISLGKFQWSKAGSYGVYGQQLPSDGSKADTGANLNRIVTLAASAGFKFASYDTNHDGVVTPNELMLMMISDNGGRIAGANRGLNPTCMAVDGNVQVCSEGNRGVAEIEDEVQFATLVHEMSHSLGTEDLYGDSSLNSFASLMGGTIEGGGPDLMHFWWLDPWHRNQLGWTDGSSRDFDLQNLTVNEVTHSDTLPRGRAVFLWDSKRGNNEYFILEYRDRSLYDRDAGDTGIAIWYVQEGTNNNRDQVYVKYNDHSKNEPGVMTYTPSGAHGYAQFLHQSNGWITLKWADGNDSGFDVQAVDDAGTYQVKRTK